MWYETLIDRGLVPEILIRKLLRLGLRKYSARVRSLDCVALSNVKRDFILKSNLSPIAIDTDTANEQHYEVPAHFFGKFLSNSMKYSGSVWDSGVTNLDIADSRTLDLYIERADLKDGQNVLELGSGWGSLCLHLARKHPNSQIKSVTNSKTQKEFIDAQAKNLALRNLVVLQSDIKYFQDSSKYDRIVSIEMFEHLRSPIKILEKSLDRLCEDGKLFFQVFSHKEFPQYFDDKKNSWMARNFFTGGMMPYDGFYEDITDQLTLENKWIISGMNYHKTLESWLYRLKNNQREILKMRETYAEIDYVKSINQFKIFIIFCSELFKFNNGNDWQLIHYLFLKK